jgi:hypothetical protein
MSAIVSTPARIHAEPSLSLALRRSDPLQRKCACGGTPGATGECEQCRKKPLRLKARYSEPGSLQDLTVPPIVQDVLNAPGQPLDTAARAFMEPRFGHDFSKVRVHTDAKASKSAGAVNAQAYAVAQDIVFAPGRYSPETKTGNMLIAHELAHVVQQSRTSPSLQSRSTNLPDDALEREADAAAKQAVLGNPVTVTGSVPAWTLQCNKVHNHPVEDFQSDPTKAKACVVHMHGEEKTALAVAKEIRSRRCVNLVHLENRRPGPGQGALQMLIAGSPEMLQPMALFNPLIRKGGTARDTWPSDGTGLTTRLPRRCWISRGSIRVRFSRC